MITQSVAKAIAQRDPDGGESKPRQSDYVAFRTWVVSTYGESVWKDYMRGNVKGNNDVV